MNEDRTTTTEAASMPPRTTADPSADPATTEPTTLPTQRDETRAARGGWRPWLPWGVAVVLAVVALYATVQWRDLADREAAREDVAAAGASFLTTLTTWDASDGLDDTRDALAGSGTDGFRSEVDDLFGGDLGAALEDVGARSRGEVRDLFVQRIEGDEALVFAVVLQTIEAGEEQPTTTLRGARLLLRGDGGRWLVHDVQLVEDGLVTGTAAP